MMHFRYRIAGLCLLAAIVGGANVFVDTVSDYETDLVLFPELFNAPLIAQYEEESPPEAMRRLGDYTQAAAHFVRARTLNPDADFVAEASRKLVASLERSGRIADARRQMDASVNIDTEPRQPGDVAVAVIGNDTVWSSALERAIGELPPEQQADLASHTDRIEFMRQYVAREMIYRAALREDYASRPEIQRQQHALLKQLLVNAFIMDKIMPTIDSDSLDIHNFYQANKTTRYNNRPLDSVMTQVVFDYSNEKARAAFDQYIQKLARAEQVEFFDRNVR